jgi:hypothetical protein
MRLSTRSSLSRSLRAHERLEEPASVIRSAVRGEHCERTSVVCARHTLAANDSARPGSDPESAPSDLAVSTRSRPRDAARAIDFDDTCLARHAGCVIYTAEIGIRNSRRRRQVYVCGRSRRAQEGSEERAEVSRRTCKVNGVAMSCACGEADVAERTPVMRRRKVRGCPSGRETEGLRSASESATWGVGPARKGKRKGGDVIGTCFGLPAVSTFLSEHPHVLKRLSSPRTELA